MGKLNLYSTGNVRKNTKISHSLRYLADLEFMRTNGIPNVYECTNFHKNGSILWKAISFPGCGFLRKLEVIMKPK